MLIRDLLTFVGFSLGLADLFFSLATFGFAERFGMQLMVVAWLCVLMGR